MILKKIDASKNQGFSKHKEVYQFEDPSVNLNGFIAIHRKNGSVPSFGATRLWEYNNPTEGLEDVLRLSCLMSYKASLAGLPCGGAKGVILLPKKLDDREKLVLSYAKSVNALNGNFITGIDVGLSQNDLKLTKKVSDFFVGINGDAVDSTARGIYYGIEASLEFTRARGQTFAIQGVGKIGEALLSFFYPKAEKIYVADRDKGVLQKIKKKFPAVSIVEPEEIHKQKVDIFIPCALGGIINSKTVGELNCKIIAGGANGQLAGESIGADLYKLGILYAPDYVINAGGLISVFDEYENNKNKNTQDLGEKIKKIKYRLKKIYEVSKKENLPTNIVADREAEKIFNSYC